MSQNVSNDKDSGQYQTDGLETAQILAYTLLQNFSGKVNFTVVSKDISNGDTFVGEASLAVKRGEGSASIVGDVVYSLPIQADLSMVTASVDVGISGSSLTFSATGVLSKTIDWWIAIDINGIQSQ